MKTKVELEDMHKIIFKISKDFYKLPIKSNSNIFEILNVVNDEETISNFLKYYFSPHYGHNLEKIFLAALQECDKDLKINNDEKILNVYREDGRIDLIIECQKIVIAIENKIYHHAKDNPLEEYQKRLEKRYPNKTPHYLILSLIEVPKKLYSKTKFKNILYRWFIKSLSKKVSEAVFDIPILHLNLLKDFISNMNYLLREDYEDPRAKFFFDNYDLYQQINEHVNDNNATLDFYSKTLKELNSFFSSFWDNEISLFFDHKVLRVAKQLNELEDFRFGKGDKWIYNLSKTNNRGWRFIRNSKFPDLIFFDLNFQNLLRDRTYSIQISTLQNYKIIHENSASLEEYFNSKINILDRIKERGIEYKGTNTHVIFRKVYQINISEIINLEEHLIKNLKKDWKDLLNDLFDLMEFVQKKYQGNEQE